MESLQSHAITKGLQELRETSSVASMNQPIGYSLAAEWIKEKISSGGAAGAQFNRGVTFSTMVPVRSIPFRVIALIGLNEGVFPRKMSSPDFDLMQLDPEPTDRNRRNEDRNLFLESIMAAGDMHYCSYIGRSQTDNEPIPPSPVVAEWISYLSKITGLDEKKIIVQAPLTRYSASSFSGIYRGYSELGYQTAKKLSEEGSTISGLYRPDLHLSEDKPESDSIDLEDFRKVVSSPIRGFLNERLGARLFDFDDENREFEFNALQRHILFDRLFGWRIHDRDGIDAESVILGSGILPAGNPGEMELNDLMDSVDQALNVIKDLGFRPEHRSIPVDVLLSGQRLLGDVRSYSSEQNLDFQISGKSARALLRGWINHLAVSCLQPVLAKESVMFCDLKNSPSKSLTNLFRIRTQFSSRIWIFI